MPRCLVSGCVSVAFTAITGIIKLSDVRYHELGRTVIVTITMSIALSLFWVFRIQFYWAFSNMALRCDDACVHVNSAVAGLPSDQTARRNAPDLP